mgnify:FL=1
MKEKAGNAKISLLLGFLFVVLFTHLPVVYTMLYHDLTGAPTAADGNMDLSGSSLPGTIILDGTWEFYWNRLTVTDRQQEQDPDLYIKVPDYWSRYEIDGKLLPADGFGSYHLTVHGLDYANPVTVLIPEFGSAYRVFIDGILASESGTVSKNLEEVFTVPRARYYPVTLPEKDSHEIVIELATT